MIKPVGDNIEIHDADGNITQRFIKVQGIGNATRYDAKGDYEGMNLTIHEVESVIVDQAKKKAMEAAR